MIKSFKKANNFRAGGSEKLEGRYLSFTSFRLYSELISK